MTADSPSRPSNSTPPDSSNSGQQRHPAVRLALMFLVFLAGLGIIGMLILVFALTLAYPNLPDLD